MYGHMRKDKPLNDESWGKQKGKKGVGIRDKKLDVRTYFKIGFAVNGKVEAKKAKGAKNCSFPEIELPENRIIRAPKVICL
jgi:hypothetical protein